VLQGNDTLEQNLFAILVFSFLFPLLLESFFFPIGFQQQPFFFLPYFLQFTEILESSHSTHEIATQAQVVVHVFNMLGAGCCLLPESFPPSAIGLRERMGLLKIRLVCPVVITIL
jgi:hypothetical protein